MTHAHRRPEPAAPLGSVEHLSSTWAWGLHRTLRAANIQFVITSAIRGPQVLTYRLRLGQASDLDKALKLHEQLAYNMSVQSVRVARTLGYVDVEVGLPDRHKRMLHASGLPQKGGAWVCLGQTPAGVPVHVRMTGNRTCHALISGTTGSGKTVSEHLIAWNLAHNAIRHPDRVRLILIDAKGGVRWRGFDREMHLAHPVIADACEAVAALSWALAELDRRKTSGQSEPAIFVIIDEIKELLDLAGKSVSEAIGRIAALGRELGIHLIVATQYPSAASVGGSLTKANLPLRLTGSVTSSRDAYISTGMKNSGAESLQGRGDFLVTVGGEMHRLQMAHVRPVDVTKLPRLPGEQRRLDLELDLDRVLDVTDEAPTIDPDHLAVALIEDRGIGWLKTNLPIGQAKATALRRFAIRLRRSLRQRGYTVYSIPEETQREPVLAQTA